MCPASQDPDPDPAVAAVADALDALQILRRGRGAPGPGGPFGPGGHGPFGRRGRGGPAGLERRRDGAAGQERSDARPDAPGHLAAEDAHERPRGPGGPGGRGRMMAVHRALAVLAAAEQPMSITELGAAIGIDQPRASRVVQLLQHEGLVRREPDPSDARRSRIAVTATGRRRADAHRERRAAPVAEALAALDPAEREQLASLLGRVVAAWPRA